MAPPNTKNTPTSSIAKQTKKKRVASCSMNLLLHKREKRKKKNKRIKRKEKKIKRKKNPQKKVKKGKKHGSFKLFFPKTHLDPKRG
jgi:hypothetical protein